VVVVVVSEIVPIFMVIQINCSQSCEMFGGLL